MDAPPLPRATQALCGPLACVEPLLDLGRRADAEADHCEAEGDPATAKRLRDAAEWMRLAASAHPSRADAVLLEGWEWPEAVRAATFLGEFFDKYRGAR